MHSLSNRRWKTNWTIKIECRIYQKKGIHSCNNEEEDYCISLLKSADQEYYKYTKEESKGEYIYCNPIGCTKNKITMLLSSYNRIERERNIPRVSQQNENLIQSKYTQSSYPSCTGVSSSSYHIILLTIGPLKNSNNRELT